MFNVKVIRDWVPLIALLVLGTPNSWAQNALPASNASPEQTTSPSSTNQIAGPAIYKKMSLEQLMDQDVTSVSKQPEPYGQAPASIEVITGDEIARSGASSIPEALRLADNLDIAQKNSHDWAISARGFNTALANKLLVLMDGRSVYTPLFSGVFWDVQDYLLADIDRIEVISGPGGTLWGANAVNGVINITSKSSKDTQGVYVEGGGGSQLQDFFGVRYGWMISSNVSARVYGKYFDRSDEVLPNDHDASDSWRMGQGGFRIDSDAAAGNNLTLQGDFYLGAENEEAGGEAHTGGGNLLGRWSHTFENDSDMSLQMYYDHTHLDDPIQPFMLGAIPLAPGGILTDDLDTYDIDFQYHFNQGERNNIVWGLGYRFTHDDVANTPSLSFLPGTLDQNLFNIFLQDEIKIVDDVHLTLGSKVEHNDYTGPEWEPSGRLQWNATKKQMFWAAISRAVRTPSRIDRDLAEPAPPNLVVLKGSPDYTSESVIAYELGYRAELGSKVSTSVSAFYNEYNNIRSTSTTPGTLVPLYFQNNVEGHTYGVELSVDYQVFDWWRLHGGYDLLKEALHVKPGETDFNAALNETSDPEHQFQIRSSLDLTRYIQFDTALRWVDMLRNNSGPTEGTVPSYFELEARLAWEVTSRLELSIVGQNLLHDHHPEYGFPSTTREEIARSVYGKVTWKF